MLPPRYLTLNVLLEYVQLHLPGYGLEELVQDLLRQLKQLELAEAGLQGEDWDWSSGVKGRVGVCITEGKASRSWVGPGAVGIQQTQMEVHFLKDIAPEVEWESKASL